jgi:hypothetical protein
MRASGRPGKTGCFLSTDTKSIDTQLHFSIYRFVKLAGKSQWNGSRLIGVLIYQANPTIKQADSKNSRFVMGLFSYS